MKRFVSLMLVLVLLLTGCSLPIIPQETEEDKVQWYTDMAQDYLDEGEYEKAVDVLEKGIEETDSQELKNMLNVVRSMMSATEGNTTESVQTLDLSGYVGTWYHDSGDRFGDPPLTLSLSGDLLSVSFVSDSTTGLQASIFHTVDVSGLTDSTVSFLYSDSWGNTGTMSLFFGEPGAVTVQIQDVVGAPDAMWGFSEGSYRMVGGIAPVELDSTAQYEINIFLSNFAEQSFYESGSPSAAIDMSNRFSVNESDPAVMIWFVYQYYKINVPGAFVYTTEGETLPMEKVNIDSNRFFGRTFDATQVADRANVLWVDGKAYLNLPGAAGESYHDLAIADEMYDNGDGTYTVFFTVYTASGSYVEVGGGITNRSVYYLDSSSAAANGQLHAKWGGVAVVRPYTYNDRESYQLVEYWLK